jgi:hypothetical protein
VTRRTGSLDPNDPTRDGEGAEHSADGATHHVVGHELDTAERHFLNRAKAGLSPNGATLQRLRASVEVALERSGPTEQASTARPTAARLTSTTGIGLFLLGVTVGTMGGFYWGVRSQVTNDGAPNTPAPAHDSNKQTEARTPLSENADPSARGPQPTTTIPEVAKSKARNEGSFAATKTAADKGRSVEREPAPPAPPAHPSDEIFLVQRVQRALAQHDPKLALVLLDKLDAEIPRGRLLEERAAGRAIAVCMSDPSRVAATHTRFTLLYPNSVHLARVNATCGTQQQKQQSTQHE